MSLKSLNVLFCILALLFNSSLPEKSMAMQADEFEEIDLNGPPVAHVEQVCSQEPMAPSRRLSAPTPFIIPSRPTPSRVSSSGSISAIPLPTTPAEGQSHRRGESLIVRKSKRSTDTGGTSTPIGQQNHSGESDTIASRPPVLSPHMHLKGLPSTPIHSATSTPTQGRAFSSSGSISGISPRQGTDSTLPMKVRRPSAPPTVARDNLPTVQVDAINLESLGGLATPQGRTRTSPRRDLTEEERFLSAPRVYDNWAGTPIGTPSGTPSKESPRRAGAPPNTSRVLIRASPPPKRISEEDDSGEDEDLVVIKDHLLERVNNAFGSADTPDDEDVWQTIIAAPNREAKEKKKPIRTLIDLGINAEQLREDKEYRENFLRKLVSSGLTLRLQNELLEIIKQCDHSVFVLNGFDAFKPTVFFQEFTLQNITELSLRQIPSVTSKLVDELPTRCPSLESLDLSYCSHLESFVGGFSRLTFLYLNRNTNMKKVHVWQIPLRNNIAEEAAIEETGLEWLELKENAKLISLKAESPTLKHIDMDDTPGVTDATLDKLATSAPHLESISCENCPQVQYPLLREKAPLLVQSSLSPAILEIIDSNFKNEKNFELTLTRLRLQTALAFQQIYGLTALSLTGCFITDDIAEVLAQNSTIQTLNLSNNYVGPRGAASLFQNTIFLILDLSRNRVKSAGAKTFGHKNSITNLNLSHNGIGDDGTNGFLENERLYSLDLSHNDIQNPLGLKHNQSIRDLNLSNNKVTDLGAETVASGHYQYLNLANNQIKDPGATHLGEGLKKLQKLILKRNKVTSVGAWYLARMPNLTYLDMSYNLLDDLAAESLSRNETLYTLNLRHNKITGSGAARFQFHKRVKVLLLGFNEIDDNGTTGLAKNETCIIIDLSHNKITSYGAKQFMLSKNLKALVLEDNNVDDDAAEVLAGHKIFQFLYISGTKIGKRGLEALQKSKNKFLKMPDHTSQGRFDEAKVAAMGLE